MTTERIVSSYVINERNKKRGGREWISMLLVVKHERGTGFYRYNLSISLDKEGITWHRGYPLATPLNILVRRGGSLNFLENMSLFLINTTYSVFICFQAKVVLYSIGKKLRNIRYETM